MDPGNLPNHVVILTKHSELLRTTLADEIENVARQLYGSFVVTHYQLKKILRTAARRPENGVSELIAIIQGSEKHFDKFIQCLSDLGYKGLVQKLQGTGSAAVGTTEKAPRTRTDNTLRLPTTPPGTGSDYVGTTEEVPGTIKDNTIPSPLTSSPTQPKPPVQYGRLPDNIGMDPFETCSRLDFSEPDFPRTIMNNTAPLPTVPRFRTSVRDRPMPDVDFRKILSNLDYLVDNIKDPIQLGERLHQKGVFNTTDIDRCRAIHGKSGRGRATRRLLIILSNRGDVYDTFIECLKECGYNYLVVRLENDGGDLYSSECVQSAKVMRGKMRSEDYFVWSRSFKYLCEQFTWDLDLIIDTMYEYYIIDAADKQQIEKARTLKSDKNGAKKLVNILGFRGENALPRIIEALKSINHDAAKYIQDKIDDFKKQQCETMDTTPVKNDSTVNS